MGSERFVAERESEGDGRKVPSSAVVYESMDEKEEVDTIDRGRGRVVPPLRAARMALSRWVDAEVGSSGRESVRGPIPSSSAADAECLLALRSSIPCSNLAAAIDAPSEAGPMLPRRSRPHASHDWWSSKAET